MRVEYKKDLRHNYMVITLEAYQEIEPYSLKIIENQEISGALSVSMRRMDDKLLFYYEISAKQSLKTMLERTVLRVEPLKIVCIGIFRVLDAAYDLLLPEDSFLISPEYIYMDLATSNPYLCYLPGYKSSMEAQMIGLIEYLMNKIDYNDKEAVILIYRLYAICREEGFNYQQLMESLNDLERKSPFQKDELEVNADPNERKDDLGNENRLVRKERINDPNASSNTSGKTKISEDVRKESTKANIEVVNRDKENLRVAKKRSMTDREVGYKSLRSHRVVQQLKNLVINKAPLDNKSSTGHYLSSNDGNLYLSENKAINTSDMPIMMERVETEVEQLYYPLKTYLSCVGCILAGVIIFYASIMSKLFFHIYRNQIDYSKVFAFLLVLLCLEGYVMNRLFNHKNRLSKLVPSYDYIDPRLIEAKPFGNLREVKLSQENSSNLQGAYHKESKEGNPRAVYAMDMNDNSTNYQNPQEAEQEDEVFNPTCILNVPAEEEDEDFNPTCILNGSTEQKNSFQLLAKPESGYNNITITSFPFFIGKLKKNVDYCLENNAISRFHAKITQEGERFYLTDLNSTNGTYLNKEALQTYEKKEIKVGDEITFANITYVLTVK